MGASHLTDLIYSFLSPSTVGIPASSLHLEHTRHAAPQPLHLQTPLTRALPCIPSQLSPFFFFPLRKALLEKYSLPILLTFFLFLYDLIGAPQHHLTY
jgi:hypothetical protein